MNFADLLIGAAGAVLLVLLFAFGLDQGRKLVAEDCANYGKFISRGVSYECKNFQRIK
jgi:hypothetical protein